MAYEVKRDCYKKLDPEKFKEASKKAYANNPEKFRKAYANDPEIFKKASKDRYHANPKKKRHTKKYKEAFKANYCECREQICSKKREEYVLHPNL